MAILKDNNGNFRAIWRILFFMGLFLLLSKIFNVFSNSFLLIQGDNLSDYDIVINRIIGKSFAFLSVLLPSIILLKYLDKRPVAMLGFGFYKGNIKELSVGMLIGLLIGGISVALLYLFGFATFSLNTIQFDLIIYLICILIILLISAAFEEVLFRGYIFQALLESRNLIAALIIFSLVFGAAHLSNDGITAYAIIFTICAGVFLGVLYFRTRSLWICIGMHYIYNFTVSPIFGIYLENSRFLRRSIFNYAEIDTNLMISSEAAGELIQSVIILIFTVFIWKSNFFKPNSYNSKLWENYPIKVVFKDR